MSPRKWPLWLRSQAAGLVWGGFMYGTVANGPRTVMQALVHLVGGVLFGLAFWGLMRMQERRTFGDLPASERTMAVRAVVTAQPPQEPRLGEVSMRVARQWARPKMRPVHHVIFFGLFVLLSVYLGVFVSFWGWFGVVFFPLAGWHSARTEQRQRQAALRFLRAAEATTPS